MKDYFNCDEDKAKFDRYNYHITRLEKLLKSVYTKGKYYDYCLVPLFMLFNFIDLLRSVQILDYNHMAVSGNIIVRSMFEILVDFLYCETNRRELYLRLIRYKEVNCVVLYNTISKEMQSQVDAEKYRNYTLPKYKDFLKTYHIKEKDNKKLLNWSGISLLKRVEIISKDIKEILDLYYNIYKVNCNYTHTYASTICGYAKIENKEIKLDYNEKYNNDRFQLICEINSLVDIYYNKFNDSYGNKSLVDIKF